MKKRLLIIISCLALIATASNAFAFADIPSTHWAKKEIDYFAQNGIINGYSDGSFRPNNKVTREEFCKMLSLSLNISSQDTDTVIFSDVPNDRWSYPYIQN